MRRTLTGAQRDCGSRLRGELGWEPRTLFEDGLRAQWQWAAGLVAAR
jgi:nucleoside-diphosphate-sugar epimerase